MRSFAFLAILSTCIAYGNLPEDQAGYGRWESTMLDAVSKQLDRPALEAIPKLGQWVMQLSQQNSPNWEKGDRPVFHAAQTALLAIPGHAEYYRDKLLEAKAGMDEEWLKTHSFSYKYAQFYNARTEVFGVLGQLPSSETVRVLGELLSLNDLPKGYDRDKADYKIGTPAEYSLEALCRLPLIPRPTNLDPDRLLDEDISRDLPVWRQWYQEIKDGKRTFRFEGDSTEYDLDGPAPKEKLERIAMLQRMKSDRSARHGKNSGAVDSAIPVEGTPVSRKPATVAIVAAALALLASVMWNFRKKAAG